MSFDIIEDGTTANIYLVEPQSYLTHRSYREVPMLAAMVLAEWQFEYVGDGEPKPATECRFEHEFQFQVTFRPQRP